MAKKSRDRNGEADLLADLRGQGVQRVRPSVSRLAKYANVNRCQTASAAFAAGVDADRAMTGTRAEMPFGQSPFAIGRGLAFEGLLRKDRYALLREVLTAGLDEDFSNATVHNLRLNFPRNHSGMPGRAAATRAHLEAIARDASGLIVLDGAVLETNVGGLVSYFEADEIAIGIGGTILVGENKSWPVVDDRPTDEDALGSALDQAATYVLLSRDTLAAAGLDPLIVSGEVAIITPRNTGLQPILHREDVEGRIRRIRRLLATVPSIDDVAAAVPAGLSFTTVVDQAADDDDRLGSFSEIADGLGWDYEPAACLTSCGFAWACRERAFSDGSTALLGSTAESVLAAVDALPRVAELGRGERPTPDEATVAVSLERAGRLFDAVVPLPRRRRSA